LRCESDEGVLCWTNLFGDFLGEKTWLMEIYTKLEKQTGDLSYLSQMIMGDMH